MYKVVSKKNEVFAVVDSLQAGCSYICRLASLGIETSSLKVVRS